MVGLCSTCMGETAAAGAVRTGIPLRGLLGDVGICTVLAGPSKKEVEKKKSTFQIDSETEIQLWVGYPPIIHTSLNLLEPVS